MQGDRLKQAETIFHAVVDLPAAERDGALTERCGRDSELRAFVEQLLHHHETGGGGMLDLSPSGDDAESVDSVASPGQTLGSYVLRERIGSGGMGEVWRAEQKAPVRRTVALKLIKAGMDSRQVIARFEAERQALALMDHPAIAKVLDAGTTPEGRPYFALDYVPGLPITDYCDARRLDMRGRLELFQCVCEGVQHAHQKALIHRDLKPSNILVADVDGKAQPRIIDFGVAKATTQKLTEKTMYTAMGQLIGTPEYMSPEQVDLTIEDVDTRTDVYSLGVILYELLAGALPFDSAQLREAGFEGIIKLLREKDPMRPSTKVSSLGEQTSEIAERRRTEPRRLTGELRGDLDWIVMRSLEKDRNRRYGSPQELAQDIQRHLDHEPVLAGPPSAAYRVRKFVRRHRVAVSVTAVMGLAVVLAFILVTVQNERISKAGNNAAMARDEAELVTTTLEEMLASVDPNRSGRDVTVREMLDETAKTLGEKFKDQPLVEARLRFTIGKTYNALGEYSDAVEQLERAVGIRTEQLGAGDPGTLEARIDLQNAYQLVGNRDDPNVAYCEQTLEIARRALGDEHLVTLRAMDSLGMAYFVAWRDHEAVTLLEKTLEIERRVLGVEHEKTLVCMSHLAKCYSFLGRYDEAETLQNESLQIQRRVLGEEHLQTLFSMSNLASTYNAQGRWDEAEALGRKTLEVERRVLGEEHWNTLASMQILANVYCAQGRYDEAEVLAREQLEICRRSRGDENRTTLYSVQTLAWVQQNRGSYAEAESLYREALETTRRVLGEGSPEIPSVMRQLGQTYYGQGRLEEAESLHREALEISLQALGEENQETHNIQYNLACYAALKGQRDEAIAFLQDVLSHGFRALSGRHWSYVLEDPDFASLHGDPEFEEIVEELRRRNEDTEPATGE